MGGMDKRDLTFRVLADREVSSIADALWPMEADLIST